MSCPGNPGHGSRFIEGTAAEKLRTVINRFLDFRQQEKNRLEANPELTLGDVTSINLTKIEVYNLVTFIDDINPNKMAFLLRFRLIREESK